MMLDPSLQSIINELPEHIIPAGQQIFHQGDSCNQYFILTAGSAHIFTRSVNGKEVNLYHVQPGDICILTTACLLSGKHFPAEAIADTDLHVRILSKKKFGQLMDTSSAFRQYVFDGFGQRMNGLIKTIQKLALETIEQRLAKYLLMQESNTIRATHSEVAAEIGSAREVVSRHFKQMEGSKLLKLARSQITILDRKALLQLT